MSRIVLLSLLLTLIYSWEECKRLIRIFVKLVFRKLQGRPPLHLPQAKGPLGQSVSEARGRGEGVDQMVSVLVMLATIPIGLTYLLAGSGNIFQKLAILGGVLLLVSTAAVLSSALVTRHNMGVSRVLPFGVGIVNLFAPAIAVIAESAYLPRRVLAKFALFLSLPPLLGLVFHHLNYGSNIGRELLPNLDILTVVLVSSLFLRITVEFLERYFRFYRLEKLFSYYRVVLGIGLAAVLLFGLI